MIHNYMFVCHNCLISYLFASLLLTCLCLHLTCLYATIVLNIYLFACLLFMCLCLHLTCLYATIVLNIYLFACLLFTCLCLHLLNFHWIRFPTAHKELMITNTQLQNLKTPKTRKCILCVQKLKLDYSKHKPLVIQLQLIPLVKQPKHKLQDI